MALSDIIGELWRRSGLSREEFASRMRVTPEHMSAVTNGREPGSGEMLEFAVKAARLDWDDVLLLPPDSETATEDDKIIDTFTKALSSAGDEADLVRSQYWTLLNFRNSRKQSRQQKPKASSRR